MFKRTLSLTVIVCFFLTTLGPLPKAHADTVAGLPQPGAMVNLSPAYAPTLIRGLKVHPENPFKFDFIVDIGDSLQGVIASEAKQSQQEQLKQESTRLIKYFLASLTIPEKDLWVNLSPYEKDRMIAQNLGQTQMGQDMLAQDYILKQLTASLIYPEKDLGKTFWDKVYTKAQRLYGTTQIPVNTFNKVWIVADKADVFERGNIAYIVGAHLKVMLEEDYLALEKNQTATRGHVPEGDVSPSTLPNDSGLNVKASQGNHVTHTVASQVVREVILPAIEQEVNQGKNFAPLRQMFYSMILASWYKTALKDALLTQIYGNQSKVKVGVNAADPSEKNKIFEQYLQAYRKGVFNYIKEDINGVTQQPMPRKYFSGGLQMGVNHAMLVIKQQEEMPAGDSIASAGPIFIEGVSVIIPNAEGIAPGASAAMASNNITQLRSDLSDKVGQISKRTTNFVLISGNAMTKQEEQQIIALLEAISEAAVKLGPKNRSRAEAVDAIYRFIETWVIGVHPYLPSIEIKKAVQKALYKLVPTASKSFIISDIVDGLNGGAFQFVPLVSLVESDSRKLNLANFIIMAGLINGNEQISDALTKLLNDPQIQDTELKEMARAALWHVQAPAAFNVYLRPPLDDDFAMTANQVSEDVISRIGREYGQIKGFNTDAVKGILAEFLEQPSTGRVRRTYAERLIQSVPELTFPDADRILLRTRSLMVSEILSRPSRTSSAAMVVIQKVQRKVVQTIGKKDTIRVDIEVRDSQTDRIGHGYYVVPAGTSAGAFERPVAKTMPEAIEQVDLIHQRVIREGIDANDIVSVAQLMLKMEKEGIFLGAQATLGYQMALAHAVADSKGKKLFQLIREELAPDLAPKDVLKTPRAQSNITNGGAHAVNSLDMQEFMTVAYGATQAESRQMTLNVDRKLGEIYKALGLTANPDDQGMGDLRGLEGGYKVEDLTIEKLAQIYAHHKQIKEDAGNILNYLDLDRLASNNVGVHRFVLEVMRAAVLSAGYKFNKSKKVGSVAIALDPATNEMKILDRNGKWTGYYKYEGRRITHQQLTDIFLEWSKDFPILSIEDGQQEEAWNAWLDMIERFAGTGVTLIGDDIFVTQDGRIEKFLALMKKRGMLDINGKIKPKYKIGILIKLNQNGFLTTGNNNSKDGYMGTLEVIRFARNVGFEVIDVSHRSKEALPEDNNSHLVDVAAAVGAEFVKIGDPVQGTRDVFYKRLSDIEVANAAMTANRAMINLPSIEINVPQVNQFVDNESELLTPGNTVVVDASNAEAFFAYARAKGMSFPIDSGGEGSFSYSTADTARSVPMTFVSSRDPNNAGIDNNWVDSRTALEDMLPDLKGSQAGKTMYVIPYVAGPKAHPSGKPGIQVTDSLAVVLAYLKLYNEGGVTIGKDALDLIAKRGGKDFVRISHSTGNLDAIKRTNKKHWVLQKSQFEELGLNFDDLMPKLIEKGYVTEGFHVSQDFTKLDDDFKALFPDYTDEQFKKLQALLLQSQHDQRAFILFINQKPNGSGDIVDQYGINIVRLFGSEYGGNGIGAKKFASLRLALLMSILGENTGTSHSFKFILENRKTHETFGVKGSFPSFTGKTNMALLELIDSYIDDYNIWMVSDDLLTTTYREVKIPDGIPFYRTKWDEAKGEFTRVEVTGQGRTKRVAEDVNPEWGLFMVAPGISSKELRRAVMAINKGRSFSINMAYKFRIDEQSGQRVAEEQWWEKNDKSLSLIMLDVAQEYLLAQEGQIDPRTGWYDWKKTPLRDRLKGTNIDDIKAIVKFKDAILAALAVRPQGEKNKLFQPSDIEGASSDEVAAIGRGFEAMWKVMTGEGNELAHPNSRITVSIEDVDNWIGNAGKLPEGERPQSWDSPYGQTTELEYYGGRLSTTRPFLTAMPDPMMGLLHGFFMRAAATAAEEGKVGQEKFDIDALKPFMVGPEGELVQHRIDRMNWLGEDTPLFAYVNVFKRFRNPDGTLGDIMWPGFKDNSRHVIWLKNLKEGKIPPSEYKVTPIGIMPTENASLFDGLNLNLEERKQLTEFNEDEWRKEVQLWVRRATQELKMDVPDPLRRELEKLAAALKVGLPPEWTNALPWAQMQRQKEIISQVNEEFRFDQIKGLNTPKVRDILLGFVGGRTSQDVTAARLVETVSNPEFSDLEAYRILSRIQQLKISSEIRPVEGTITIVVEESGAIKLYTLKVAKAVNVNADSSDIVKTQVTITSGASVEKFTLHRPLSEGPLQTAAFLKEFGILKHSINDFPKLREDRSRLQASINAIEKKSIGTRYQSADGQLFELVEHEIVRLEALDNNAAMTSAEAASPAMTVEKMKKDSGLFLSAMEMAALSYDLWKSGKNRAARGRFEMLDARIGQVIKYLEEKKEINFVNGVSDEMRQNLTHIGSVIGSQGVVKYGEYRKQLLNILASDNKARRGRFREQVLDNKGKSVIQKLMQTIVKRYPQSRLSISDKGDKWSLGLQVGNSDVSIESLPSGWRMHTGEFMGRNHHLIWDSGELHFESGYAFDFSWKQETDPLVAAFIRPSRPTVIVLDDTAIRKVSAAFSADRISGFVIKSLKEANKGDELDFLLISKSDFEADPDRLTYTNAAMAVTNPNGGIDLNRTNMQMNLHRQGNGVQMQFDPAMIARIRKNGFEGVEFEVESIIPVTNLPLLLGLQSPSGIGRLAKI